MRRTLASLGVALLAACGSRSPALPDGAPPPPDGALPPDGAQPPDAVGEVTIAFVTPASELVYERDTLTLALAVGGRTPDQVELARDGAVFAVLSPPYVYAWDTTTETETAHLLEARAVIAGEVVATDSLTVVVDRTRPTIVARAPDDGESHLLSEPIRFDFSEPMDPASIDDDDIVFTRAGEPLARTWTLAADAQSISVTLLPPAPPTPSAAGVDVELMADLAGNLLIPDNWAFAYPVFFEMFEPLPGLRRLDAAMASDGTIFVVYTDTDATLAPPNVLRVAAWDGSAWVPVGGPVTTWDDSPEARLLLTSLDQPIVVHRASHAYAWDGSAWITLAALSPAGAPLGPPYNWAMWDARVTPGDQVLLAREIASAANGYDVLRAAGGGWTIDASFSSDFTEARRISLLPTSDGFLAAYRSGNSCLAAESTASGIEPLPAIHTAAGSQNECWDLTLERGDDGEIYAGISRFNPPGTGMIVEGKVLRLGTGGWVELPIDGGFGVTALAPWGGSIVAGVLQVSGAGLATPTETWPALPVDAYRILIHDGRPLVLARRPGYDDPGRFYLLNLL